MMAPSSSKTILSGSQIIYNPFTHFSLQMHIGNSNKSKTEAMYFLTTLGEAEIDETPEDLILSNRNSDIPFTMKFHYLGSIITPKLNQNAEIKARIKKASSQMGILKHFSSKDVDPQIKYWVYIAGPLNCLLCGCESWNIPEKKKKKTQKLSSLSHQKNSRNHLEQSKRRKNHKRRSQIPLLPNPRH